RTCSPSASTAWPRSTSPRRARSGGPTPASWRPAPSWAGSAAPAWPTAWAEPSSEGSSSPSVLGRPSRSPSRCSPEPNRFISKRRRPDTLSGDPRKFYEEGSPHVVLDRLGSLGEGRRLKRLQEIAELTNSFEPETEELTDA